MTCGSSPTSGSSPTRASLKTSTSDLWVHLEQVVHVKHLHKKILIVMSQEGPSRRNRVTKKRAYAKPGTLSFLVQQRRSFLTTQETHQAMRSEKKNLLKLIEKKQPITKQE
ncbi:hypothetical protein AABB24_036979 [Solanum stoloniferum]|uniref:Uncharacterized protein n=1 Tax=Solanum stoloniferum TaxID=62892 RepID=A0ABD2R2M3_9SOLN